MTAATGVLMDGFARVRENAHRALEGVTAEEAATQPKGEVNSIAWLVWHIGRVQDLYVAEYSGAEQVWTSAGWSDRFALPFPPDATGYGQSSDEVAAVVVEPVELLARYLDVVTDATKAYLGGLADSELDRVVDESFDPPVTLSVRLVSILEDNLLHAGQAEILRWLLRV